MSLGLVVAVALAGTAGFRRTAGSGEILGRYLGVLLAGRGVPWGQR